VRIAAHLEGFIPLRKQLQYLQGTAEASRKKRKREKKNNERKMQKLSEKKKINK